MKFVEILKLQNDGIQVIIATCKLEDGKVVCEGEESFVKRLQEDGIRNYTAKLTKKLYFHNGEKFLDQLKYNFKSGYLNATGIQEK